MKIRVCSFNNKGFPKMKRLDVNWGDYMVRDTLKPDLLGEQERWFLDQLAAFRKIFSKVAGYNTYRPAQGVISGTIIAYKPSVFKHLAHFSYFGHAAVPGVCAYRNYTGVIGELPNKKTALFGTGHPTPSAWSSRLNKKPTLKKWAQRAWHKYMDRVITMTTRQIKAGRDYAIWAFDANAGHHRLVDKWPKQIGGKPVRVLTSQYGYKIDHIVIVGDIDVLKEDFLKGTPSDHAPFWADLELR